MMLPEEMVTQYDILVYEINNYISFDGFSHLVVRFSVPLMQGSRKPAIFSIPGGPLGRNQVRPQNGILDPWGRALSRPG